MIPWEVCHLWEWFVELGAVRSNGMGPEPVSYAEIGEWARLTGRQPTPWEVATLRLMAVAAASAISNGSKTPDNVREIAADDTAGVAALFAGLKAKANAK